MPVPHLRRPTLGFAFVLVTSILAGSPALGQAVDDGLGVPGPISFAGTDYFLAWTAHPNATYYKQEYLPEGQAFETYTEMFIVEAVTSGATPEAAVALMVGNLDQRKSSDPVVNYQVIRNDQSGEFILDFILSDSSGGAIIVEWNAYRYTRLGDDGVALFAISRRGYDDGAEGFLAGIRDWRPMTIDALVAFEAPALSPGQ